MKSTLLILLSLSSAAFANPEIANIIAQEYGAATSEGIVLLQSAASAAEPQQWYVFARDPFRSGELVKADLTIQGRSWVPKPAGAGEGVLRSTPPGVIAFSRVKYRSSDVRGIAARAAVAAKTTFATIEYQLAVNQPNGAPEWGMALLDASGVEVGFVLVSAETGAITMEQWASQVVPSSGGLFSKKTEPGSKGERAAQDVKESARRAWDWTDGARKETKSFFKELFSRD